jgi:uncharacterized protein YjiS (DUF1127 family)
MLQPSRIHMHKVEDTMTELPLATCSGRPASGGFFQTGLRVFRFALALNRQRRSLLALDDAALKDIGISRSEALTEANRPVWDVTPSWCR